MDLEFGLLIVVVLLSYVQAGCAYCLEGFNPVAFSEMSGDVSSGVNDLYPHYCQVPNCVSPRVEMFCDWFVFMCFV